MEVRLNNFLETIKIKQEHEGKDEDVGGINHGSINPSKVVAIVETMQSTRFTAPFSPVLYNILREKDYHTYRAFAFCFKYITKMMRHSL